MILVSACSGIIVSVVRKEGVSYGCNFMMRFVTMKRKTTQGLKSLKQRISKSIVDVNDDTTSAELIQILFDNGVMANIVVVVAIVIINYIFKGQLSFAFLSCWSLYMVGVASFRFQLVFRYQKNDKKTTADYNTYKNHYLVGTAGIAFGWSVLAVFGLSLPSFEYHLVVVLLVVSLLAASVTVLASSLSAMYIFIFPPCVTTILLLFSQGGKELVIGVALCIFFSMVLRSGIILYKTLLRSITLGIHNQSLADNLEKKVAERTLELQESRNIAQKANKAKSEFLANMSHEIRTPMNAIIHFSQLALQEEMSSQSRDYVDRVNSSSVSLLRIINDILDLSKIESGKLDIEQTTFSLSNLVKEVLDTFTISMEKKGLHLYTDLPETLHDSLIGDPFRIQQILTNLVSNAVKFTEIGKIEITLREHTHTRKKIVIEFEVTDTGIGMTEEQQNSLFQPFQQGDSSTTRQFGGTGLGLMICKQLIGLMGGTITVKSNYGKGSTFSFRIPFEYAAFKTDMMNTENQLQTRLEKDLTQREGAEILVVEDNEANQVIITSILENSGFKVILADNGKIALHLLENHSYDLVLMDIQMPEMDGYEATRRIRSNRRWDKLPIVAMTANAMQDDIVKCHDVGMNGHLSKPLDMVQLHTSLIDWIPPRC